MAFGLFLATKVLLVVPELKQTLDNLVVGGRIVRSLMVELANACSAALRAHHTFASRDYFVDARVDEPAVEFQERCVAYSLEARTFGTAAYGKNVLGVLVTFIRSLIIVSICIS